jgi:hypothetical protein
MIRNVRGSFDTLQPNLVIHKDGDQILDGAITILAARAIPTATRSSASSQATTPSSTSSDLAHNHVLMLEDPNWFIDFDHNPEVAIATRKKVFARSRPPRSAPTASTSLARTGRGRPQRPQGLPVGAVVPSLGFLTHVDLRRQRG